MKQSVRQKKRNQENSKEIYCKTERRYKRKDRQKIKWIKERDIA